MIGSLGIATYYEPMKLWDKASGNLTDFKTHFSFVIDSQQKTKYGDGLAFFLPPAGSKLDPNITKGASMGLTQDDQPLHPTGDPFVAVEFDIYNNSLDPTREHVGIDINSIQSRANVTWLSSIPQGKKNDAWITYNSSTKNLSVVFTGYKDDNSTVLQHLSYEVDLRLYLPERVTFGFTAATGNASALHSIYSWDFSSTLRINEDQSVLLGTPSRSKKKTVLIGVGLGAGGLLGLFVVGSYFVWIRLRKRIKNKEDHHHDHMFDSYMDSEFQNGSGVPKKYSYPELARATNNFKDDAKLGQGGFGGVYKGLLGNNNTFVAVKRVSKGSKQGIKEYATEVKIISRLRHKNLVQLIGWCHERRDLLLVYEYIPNGSLDSHLFKEKKLLTWEFRYKIAQGLASALLYLHEECQECVVHRDIKSSNIMLDSNFDAKLGDFGLARLMDPTTSHHTTGLAGTFGYMAPEYISTRKASKGSDVFSFGVVLLGIACGRRSIENNFGEDQIYLVEWVWDSYASEKLLGVVDERLCTEFDVKQMESLLIVGLWCVHPDHNLRPSIRQAIQVLNFEAPFPDLPKKMPVPNYNAPIFIPSVASVPLVTYSSLNIVGR